MATKPRYEAPVDPPAEDLDKAVHGKSGELARLDSEEATVPVEFSSESSLVAMPLETIPNTVPLPCTLYIKFGTKTLLFRRQGDRLSNKRAAELQAKGTQALFIHKAFWQMFMDSLEQLKLPEPVTPEAHAIHVRHLLLAYGQELEKRIREPKKPYFEKMRKNTDTLAGILHATPHVASKLLRDSNDAMLYFINHSVNVSVFACLLGVKLKFNLEDLKQLAYAALVHDVGQLFVPKRILHKSTELSDDETEQMRMHPRKGAELLESFTTPGKIVQAVYQHHERWDGNGYPSGHRKDRINQYARIIAIADMYDALTSKRPFKDAIAVNEALAQMKEASQNGQLDPNMTALVINEMVFPPKSVTGS